MTLTEMFDQAAQLEQAAKDLARAGDEQAAQACMEQAEAWFDNACAIEAKHALMRQHGFVEIMS